MNKDKSLKNEKNILLKDSNIKNVSINSNKETITIYPKKDKYYLLMSDYLHNFNAGTCFKIGRYYFALTSYESDYDNFQLTLKKIG